MTLTLSLLTLPAGKAEGDGKMHITLCDFIVPWDTLSTTQKKSLNHRYQMGCECKVSQICVLTPPWLCHHRVSRWTAGDRLLGFPDPQDGES